MSTISVYDIVGSIWNVYSISLDSSLSTLFIACGDPVMNISFSAVIRTFSPDL